MMLRLKACIFVIPLLFVPASVCPESNFFDDYELKYVVSRNGLNVREQPSLNGKIVKAVGYSTRIHVCKYGKVPAVVNSESWHWVKVYCWGNAEGWAFNKYLVDPETFLKYKDALFGRYFLLISWQSGFAHGFELLTDCNYKLRSIDHGRLLQEFSGKFWFESGSVVLGAPSIIKQCNLSNFPIKLKTNIIEDTIVLRMGGTDFWKYPDQMY